MKGTEDMTAKQYLSELQAMKTKIGQLQEQRQMYLEMATSITTAINPVKVQTSKMTDRMGDNVSKAADVGMKIDEEINALFWKQQEIIKQIQSLRNADYMQILFKVYVQEKNIKQAAAEMERSYNYALGIHKKALKRFEEMHRDVLMSADELRTGVQRAVI